MLAYEWQSSQGLPVVFLHGLLGSTKDWQTVFERLQTFPQIRPLAIDLPYHGHSRDIHCQNFDEVRQLLHHTLQAVVGSQPFCLVGYSLGGRIALDYHFHAINPALQATYVEGAHLGLVNEQERTERLASDLLWAKRFRTEPIADVLAAWYQQPVFSHLTPSARAALVALRQQNDGVAIASMLEATSLAKQPFLGEKIALHTAEARIANELASLLFMIGEYDRKFRDIAASYHLPHKLITQAGHNSHQENPARFVEILLENIAPYIAKNRP